MRSWCAIAVLAAVLLASSAWGKALHPELRAALAQLDGVAPKRPKGQLRAARIVARRIVAILRIEKLGSFAGDFQRELARLLPRVQRAFREREISGAIGDALLGALKASRSRAETGVSRSDARAGQRLRAVHRALAEAVEESLAPLTTLVSPAGARRFSKQVTPLWDRVLQQLKAPSQSP